MWKLDNNTQNEVEKRGQALGVGEPGWVRANMRLFTKTYQLKGVDWLNLSRGAGLEIFDGCIGEGLPDDERANLVEAWESLLVLFQMCCITTCNVDGRPATPAMLERYK
jgi:hypothetical protein